MRHPPQKPVNYKISIHQDPKKLEPMDKLYDCKRKESTSIVSSLQMDYKTYFSKNKYINGIMLRTNFVLMDTNVVCEMIFFLF